MVSGSHKYVAFIEEGRRKLLIEMLNTIESRGQRMEPLLSLQTFIPFQR